MTDDQQVDPPLGRWMPPFGVQVASAVGLTALFIAWVRGQWGGPWATVVMTDLVSIAVPLGAAWACALRARTRTDQLRLAWFLMAGACLAWALGQVAWTAVELRTGEPPPTPSLADVGYLLFPVLAAIAAAAMVRRAGPGIDPRPLLDGAIVGSSFIFIAFVFGLEAVLLASDAGDPALILNLLYPFGDGVLLGVVLMRLSRAPARARGAMGLLALGSVFLAVADLWFLVVDAQGLYSTGGVLDAFWILGFQCIGLAATRPGNLQGVVDAPPSSTWLALVPLYPVALALLSSIQAERREGHLSDTLYWSALVVIVLLVGRLIVMLLDNFALSRAQEAEKATRTQMLNNITHDLLSPLSAVRIQLSLLATDGLGPRSERQEHALRIVGRNVERVNRLGGDLKDLANLEGKGLKMLPTDMDLAHEVLQAVANAQGEAQQRAVHLEVEAPPSAPMRGDAGRIGQVLDNLLSNALKFTPSGGRVTVRVAGRDGAWSVAVTDTGRGLAPEEMARLFRPFSQVHKPGEIKERGTGLGLFISRGIAQGHGGHLDVASAGLGSGCTFTLVLPTDGGLAPPSANGGPAVPGGAAGNILPKPFKGPPLPPP